MSASAERFDSIAPALPQAHTVAGVVADLVSLTKPRLSALVLVTTAGGFLMAPGELRPWPLLLALAGVAMIVGGAQTLNCLLERDVDRLMLRTRMRPLPARRLPPAVALVMGSALALIALPFLWLETNPLTAALAALAFVSYVFVYTPMKRVSSLATLVGALPGALPPLLGWTAATGRIALPGLALFGILFLWQIPHFLALSVMLRDDYARAGLWVLPLDGGDAETRRNTLLWAAALVPVSLLPAMLGLASGGYAIGAVIDGVAFAALAWWGLAPGRGRSGATKAFLGSILYLSVLFALLVVGRN